MISIQFVCEACSTVKEKKELANCYPEMNGCQADPFFRSHHHCPDCRRRYTAFQYYNTYDKSTSPVRREDLEKVRRSYEDQVLQL